MVDQSLRKIADERDVIASSRGEDAVSETADLIESYDADTAPVPCNIINGDSLAEFWETAERSLEGPTPSSTPMS